MFLVVGHVHSFPSCYSTGLEIAFFEGITKFLCYLFYFILFFTRGLFLLKYVMSFRADIYNGRMLLAQEFA